MTVQSRTIGWVMLVLSVMAFFILVGCDSSQAEKKPDECAKVSNKFEVCYVPLSDGRSIPCVLYGRFQQMSCDWYPK